MYKIERFIDKCLRSILEQTYTQLEVIAVNDCSPDNTLSIVQNVASKDKRVKIVDLKKNGGVSNARYEGFLQAAGEYIMFVDGDDFLPKDAMQTLHNEMLRCNADIVEGGMYRVMDSRGIIKRAFHSSPMMAEHNELMDKYFISFFGVNILSVALWGKLYKHDLIAQTNAMQPTSFRMGEDLMANLIMFPVIKRYSRIAAPVYNYRWGGVTSSYNKTLYADLKAQYYLKLKVAEGYKYGQIYRALKVEMCNVTFSHLVQLMRFGYGRNTAKDFLQSEIDCGFVREITTGIEYYSLTLELLKELKIEKLLDLAEKEANSKKWLRWIVKRIASIIN